MRTVIGEKYGSNYIYEIDMPVIASQTINKFANLYAYKHQKHNIRQLTSQYNDLAIHWAAP